MQKKTTLGRNRTVPAGGGNVPEENGLAELTQPLIDGSKEAELTRPLSGGEDAETENAGDVITPEDIAEMTAEEFSEYINSRPEADESEDGADTDTQDTAADDEADPADETEPDKAGPYRVFNTREEYEADMRKAVAEAFRKRFGSAEEDSAELNRIRRSARGSYRGSDNPIQDMLDDMDSHAAKEAGKSIEEYRKGLDENEAFEQWKAEKAQAEQQRKSNERIIAQWYADAARLQQLVPEFDFNAAIQNMAFSSAIRNGDSVAMAYMRMRDSAPKQPKRKEITQNATSARRGTGGSSVNPATMPTSDYIAYINKQAGRKLL